MSTKFQHVQEYPADPTTVMAMLRDPEFMRLKCDRTGSRQTTVDVQDAADGGCTLVTTRVLPANVPAVAAPFVGDTLTVTETQVWTAPAADGSATGTASVDFGAPISFTATLTLQPTATGSSMTTSGEFKASVPFVGGKIEGVAVDQTSRYLVVEEKVGHEWLAGTTSP